MFDLASLSAFSGILVPGRYGKPDGDAGVTVVERAGLGLATVEVRKDRDAALKGTIRDAYGLDLPDGPTVAGGSDVRFIGTGRGQWLSISESLAHERLADDLMRRLKGLASVSDQSSGRAVLRVRGPKVRDVLAKGLAVDLDPRVFGPESAVTSVISHMGVLVWREGEAEVYDIALFRSVAESFWRWLSASAAEYGYTVAAAGKPA